MFTFSNLCAFFTSRWSPPGSRIQAGAAPCCTMWLILAVTVLVFLVIRDRPSVKNLTPWGVEHKAGEAEAKPDPATLPGAQFKTSLRSLNCTVRTSGPLSPA